MKGLVYHGPGKRSWDEVPDPTIEQSTDVVVRIDSSTICGTDLHILKGDVPTVLPGTILGHEADDWDNPPLRTMYFEAMRWALRLVDGDASPRR